jgi:hypothetical protein
MKATMTAVAIMGLCTALLSSCNKKGNDIMPDSTYAPAQQNREAGDDLSYHYTGGAVNAVGISVMDGQAMLTEIRHMQSWSLFDPMVKMGLPIPMGTYRNLTTSMDMLPNGDVPSLVLRGDVMINTDAGDQMMAAPFEFLVTAPLSTHLNSGIITLGESSNLINLLNLNLKNLTTNIPMDLWQHAYDANPKLITISETSNPELYHLMFNNLQAMLHPSDGGPGAPSTTATVVEVASPM